MAKNVIIAITLALAGISFLQASEQRFGLAESVRLGFEESAGFQWEPSSPPDSAVYLVFDARIDAGDFTSGGAPALQVLVNGVPVTVDRLENKQTQWIHGTRRYVSWGTENTLMVLYHKWDDEALQFGRLHRYVFDITSLLKQKGENTIQFIKPFIIEGTYLSCVSCGWCAEETHYQVG